LARVKGAGPAQREDAGEARKPDAFGKRATSSRSSHPNQYAVADGRTALGVVEQVGDCFVAITVDGSTIGTFPSLREASRALPGGGERGRR
jgi:hypothetical protein